MQDETVVMEALSLPDSGDATYTEQAPLKERIVTDDGKSEVETKVEEPKTEPKTEEKTEPKPEAKEDAKVKKNGYQSRIDELRRSRGDAERRANALEKQLAELQKAAPTAEKFTDDAEYQRAQSSHNMKHAAIDALKTNAQIDVDQSAEAEAAELRDTWEQRVEAASAAKPNIRQTLSTSQVKTSPAMEHALYKSEIGPEIALWLHENPKTADQIFRMSPLDAAMEMKGLEIRLNTVHKPEAKKITTATQPIEPLTARNAAGATDDFERWKEKRNKERGRY